MVRGNGKGGREGWWVDVVLEMGRGREVEEG